MVENVPTVSVVIPAYNAEGFLARAIRSVLAQTRPPSEIVIVDDGSTDRTREIAESFGASVRCIRQNNRGAAAARNRGIEESKGSFIAFLDSDDEWLPERLEKTLAPLLKNRAVGLAYCRSIRVLENGTRALHHEEAVKGRLAGGIYPPPYISTPATIFRRECFDRCGLFDAALSQNEDIDLFIRVAEEFVVAEVAEPLVIVHGRPKSLSTQAGVDAGADILFRCVCKALGRGKAGRDRDAALAAAYFHAGVYYLAVWRYGRARFYFLIAWLLKPSWRVFKFLMRTLVPAPLVRAARWFRDRRRRKDA